MSAVATKSSRSTSVSQGFFTQPQAFSSLKDDWETPPDVFAELDREFQFTLDPCCSPKTAKCPTYFTKATNGLIRSWRGHRAYMNPPYGRDIKLWMAKAHRECKNNGVLVVALVPARTDTAWWHDHVLGAGAEVRFLRGRIAFWQNGAPGGKAPFPSAVVIYRANS